MKQFKTADNTAENIITRSAQNSRIEELKEDFRIRNQITPEKHMARLNHLGRKAETENMIKIEKDRAVDEIKTKVVDLTFAVTEKIIKKNISSKENKNLIEESLKGLKKYSA